MDQSELIEILEDRIIDVLPEEAVDALLAIPQDGENHDPEVMEILQTYHIDPNAMAQQLKKEQNNE